MKKNWYGDYVLAFNKILKTLINSKVQKEMLGFTGKPNTVGKVYYLSQKVANKRRFFIKY